MSFFYATLCAFSILVNNSCKQQATSASTSLFSNEGSKMKGDEEKKSLSLQFSQRSMDVPFYWINIFSILFYVIIVKFTLYYVRSI